MDVTEPWMELVCECMVEQRHKLSDYVELSSARHGVGVEQVLVTVIINQHVIISKDKQ